MAQRPWSRLMSYLRPTTRPARAPVPTAHTGASYPGDYIGEIHTEYAPHPDGRADAGEVVWGWVPYEEDHSRGKDRPALVIGHDGRWLLALPLTSKDHHRDAAQEAVAGRQWRDIGSGGWDASGRSSEVRIDRVVRLDPTAVRREGAALDRARFNALIAEVQRVHRD
jgi:hypothetical protein